MIFLVRNRQGTSFRLLEDFLIIDHNSISFAYYEVICHYKSIFNVQYQVWNNPNMSKEEKDLIYERVYDEMDTLQKILADRMFDPLGFSRRAIFLAIGK